MKKAIIALALFGWALTASAKGGAVVVNDTLPIKMESVSKVVIDETTNSKGKRVTRHYMICNGELLPTTKKVVEMYSLCKKHNAKCALAIVKSGKSNRKRVILN